MEPQPYNEPKVITTEPQNTPSLLQRLQQSIETTPSQRVILRDTEFDDLFPAYSHHDD
jgi:hypothetical protein